MKIAILVISLFASRLVVAQDVFKVHQGWIDMTVWYKVNENTRIGGDFGYRTTVGQFSFHQWYVRPTIRWRKNAHYTLLLSMSNHHTISKESVDLNELRFAQQIQVNWPNIGQVKFNHRVRFEERFFFIDDEQENAMRARYRLALVSPDFTLFGIGSKFYGLVSWEAFIQIGSSYEDIVGNSHRWELELGNRVSEKMRIGLHYIWQTLREVDDLFALDLNILRLRVTYTIN